MNPNDQVLREIVEARARGAACALVTVAEVHGSVPRAAGAKMLVFPDGEIVGTIGGGKFESLVVEEAREALRAGRPLLRKFPLREDQPDSFGAICGGEVTVFIEPQARANHLCVVGAGHCGQAIAAAALPCGFAVTVVDDRAKLSGADHFEHAVRRACDQSPEAFISATLWEPGDAIVLVSRNFEIDRAALDAAVKQPVGYIGMIGSRRKVLRVFDDLVAQGFSREDLNRVYAPIGLDIGADSPAEIAVSVVAEILKVQRGATGAHLRL